MTRSLARGAGEFPIVMKVWMGTEAHDYGYVSRSIPSLLGSRLPKGADILIFDDCSPDPRCRQFLQQIASADHRIRVIRHEVNKGPNLGQADAYALVEEQYPDAPFYVNVDDDVVYHVDWLNRLIEAKETLERSGVTGVLTALNMPFRRPFARMVTEGHEYLFKWRQPALNWLIPREVYRRVGPFVDEGVAYDMVYSHRLRLHGHPVICLRPSYVQNIGTFGAYSVDWTTTAPDFLGEGAGWSRMRRLGGSAVWHAAALGRAARQRLRTDLDIIWPIRWGAEWVYEGTVGSMQTPVAYFLFEDAVRFGWTESAWESRAGELFQSSQPGPFAMRQIRHTLRGGAKAVECHWRYLPTLRECRMYPALRPKVAPSLLCRLVAADLRELHGRNVVHNKIRPENVFMEYGTARPWLAWFGTELMAGVPLPRERAKAVELLSSAVDARARTAVRERFAASYVAGLSPEVLDGTPCTPASDVYALGATFAQYIQEEDILTMEQVHRLKAEWSRGIIRPRAELGAEALLPVLGRCLASKPESRYRDAADLEAALAKICS